MLKKALKQTACGLLFFLVSASVASASDIGVSPTRVTLSDSQQIETLTLSNNGNEPIIMQMEVLSWTQQEGKDVFTPTREVLANPPIFTVPAGGSQLVRFGARRKLNTQQELTYRIFIEELPPPPDPDSEGTQMLMRLSIPVFVLPEIVDKPILQWEAARTSQGDLKISLINNGNAHIQIINFKLSLPGSTQPWITQKSSRYILTGQSHNWILPNAEFPIPPAGTTLQLLSQTDAGVVNTKIMIPF